MTVTEQRFSLDAMEVFEALTDPERYPRWLVGTKRIRNVSPAWPVTGSTFGHVVGFGPVVIADRTTVLEGVDGSLTERPGSATRTGDRGCSARRRRRRGRRPT